MSVPRLVAVTTPDDPDRWEAAGFAVVGGAVALGPVEVRCGVDGPASLVFAGAHPGGLDDLDGVPWQVDDAAPPPQPSRHPNGVDGFDHVVVVSPDLVRVRDALHASGIEIRRERAATIGGTDVVQLFAFAGDALLEVVAPASAADAPPDAPSDAPATIWGVAATASDLDEAVAALGGRASPARPAVQRGRRISSLRTGDLGLSLTVAVMSPRP